MRSFSVTGAVSTPRSASQGEKDSKKNASKKGLERLSELLRLEVLETALDELEVERKMQILNEFQNVVKHLQSGEEKKVLQRQAAINVIRLAKDDSEARTMLAMLGAIPLLVGMLDYEEAEFLTASLYALLNLAIGNNLTSLTQGAISFGISARLLLDTMVSSLGLQVGLKQQDERWCHLKNVANVLVEHINKLIPT